ncbi:NADPH:quinone reductase [Rhizocola hellebori]|uniref:NADPH:quinone reductase n=1 Tax=Rhizocola hellebori TaxID=1392758 RepID=A0A8J3VCY7_9ACTN|nr:NAD(P)-dependent alcohol dehydrogenase [Rhizocola hellebori]GIH02037.1 NADPH:quinone reductase [Rhizocola hellebori]
MKAFVYREYGTSEVLQLEDVAVPEPGDEQVLVRVIAASVNPYDWHHLTGKPYLVRLMAGFRRPKEPTMLGADMAGRVESVGSAVTRWRPGDEVFGMRSGAFGEYVVCGQDRLARKPANVTFEQAAAVPMAGLTALQSLRDKGKVKAGQQVLIIGASGGVGTLAVQLAKAFGAHVTAVCSTRNVETVRGLGADRVIDYTGEDFVHSGHRYDLILDGPGNRSIRDRRRVLARNGILVMYSGPKKNRWVGPLLSTLRVSLASSFGTQKMTGMMTSNSKADLDLLGQLMAQGKVTPWIERTHPLVELPRAIDYVGTGHARGKVVITIG